MRERCSFHVTRHIVNEGLRCPALRIMRRAITKLTQWVDVCSPVLFCSVCSPLQVDIILPVWYYDTSGVAGGRSDQRNPPVLFVVCRLLRHSLRVNRLAVVLLTKRVDALSEGKRL